MALDRKNLIALAKITARASANSPTAYSFGENNFNYTELNDLLRKELNDLSSSYALYRENKNLIFTIMETAIDDVLPKKVMEQYGQFAETQVFEQGDKPVFVNKITAASKRRAKKFVTKVGLAGIYEVFKLDGSKLEIPTSAYGGAAQIAFEEFLDGRIQMSDVLDIVMEGLDEQIFFEIEKALEGAVANMPAANKATGASFDETEMDRLISVADSYGKATIFCTFEFAATMIPKEAGWVSEEMKNNKWNNGYLGNYKGHPVIVLNQSFVDEKNAVKVINPANAWIIPTGTEKPVKIAFEGQTIVRDIDNDGDMSKEIQIYKKFGVGVIASNNICRYKNTSLNTSVGSGE